MQDETTHLIKVATVAPEGSSWAHGISAFAKAVETRTKGAVKIKLYYGGQVPATS